ncbi:MAG: mevalonate kinase, partial [Anaerolineales bacterium]|nr:mevalonate kinase [Anaerolineales bacterium]
DMPALSATAPAKIILLGEHAVVYGRPAIAIPVRQRMVKVIIKPQPGAPSGQVRIKSPSIQLDALLEELPDGDPILAVIQETLMHVQADSLPACSIRITSDIPVAAGLGSGAAVSVATSKAVAGFLGRPLGDQEISDIAYRVETIHHGTPSGIDNTVIAFNQAIYFQKDKPVQFLDLRYRFQFIIADTGIPSPTRETVSRVRENWQTDVPGYNSLFNDVADIVNRARQSMERGDAKTLGRLLNENQALLAEMGVSSSELDQLIRTARAAGALGAKLSGGGGGGNMIALVDQDSKTAVAADLKAAGAVRIFHASIS